MVDCFIKECKNEGTLTITDAMFYPQIYNGKTICEEHNKMRKYMKDDESKESQSSTSLLNDKTLIIDDWLKNKF